MLLCPFLLESQSKIELKIAMNTWDIFKATYLIALLHISNEHTAYLFEISTYIKYFETSTKHLLCGIKGSTFDFALKRGRAPSFFITSLDSPMIGNILTTFEKKLLSGFFFQGNDLKRLDERWLEASFKLALDLP